MLEVFVASTVFVLGACIGSFLNVCIVRMPKEESVVAPRSHCVSCQKMIPWYDNIPILSYFILGGKCRFCGARFCFRYALVEVLTALAFLGLYFYFGPTQKFFVYIVMVSCFIVAAFVDFEHRIIPDEISIGGMFVGLGLSVIFTQLHNVDVKELAIGRLVMQILVGLCLGIHLIEFFWHRREFDDEDRVLLIFILGMVGLEWVISHVYAQPLTGVWGKSVPYLKSIDASLIGLLAGGGIIYIMGLIGDFIFRKESMGGGDVKLMALVGAFMGWKLAVLTFFVAPFFGAVYGIIEKIRTKDSAIAYGPFLVLGALVCLFYGDVIIKWILGQYGVTL